jgi:hypothetical protein
MLIKIQVSKNITLYSSITEVSEQIALSKNPVIVKESQDLVCHKEQRPPVDRTYFSIQNHIN